MNGSSGILEFFADLDDMVSIETAVERIDIAYRITYVRRKQRLDLRRRL